MGRHTPQPIIDESGEFVYTGNGLNIQTSYLFDGKWEVALRNSTMFPDAEARPFVGYRIWNQSTIGVTRYLIGHSLKFQLDLSYNHRSEVTVSPDYDRWMLRFQVELGL